MKALTKNKLLAFLAVSAILIGAGVVSNIATADYKYDAADYYCASKSFYDNGCFSFLNYQNEIRGYAFPLILMIICRIGTYLHFTDGLAILVANVLVCASTVVYLIPFFLREKNINICRACIPCFFIIVYWLDLIKYPLSDIWALFVALLASLISVKNLKFLIKKKYCLFMVTSLVVGAFMYLMYNIRTIYLFAIPIIVIYGLYNIATINEKSYVIKGTIIFLYIFITALGFMVAGIPQYIINCNIHNENSIMVVTAQNNSSNLFYTQLTMGLYMDRYETYVGESNQYPVVPVNFIDKEGLEIIARESIDTIKSFRAYIIVILKYPLDYVSIMARHVVSAMYLPYREIYVTNINGSGFVAMINWTVIFMAAIYYKNNNKILGGDRWACLAVFIPCALIIPSAIETRFFIAVYLFMYVYIANPKDGVVRLIKAEWKKIICLYIIYIVLISSISGSIMSSAQYIPLLLK